MNVKKSLENRLRGWLPKTPNLPKQRSVPSFKKTKIVDEKSATSQNFPSKPSTDFMSGALIGGSAIVLLAGLLVWSSLDSTYWYQRNALITSGLDISHFDFIFSSTVLAISLCAAAVVFSSYLLIHTSARRLNPTIRRLTENNGPRRNWNDGLLSGGALAITFSAQNLVFSFYPWTYTNPFLWVGFGVAGTMLIIVGVLRIAISYRNIRKQLGKV